DRLLFAAEVVEEGAHRDVGLGGDLLDGDVRHAVPQRQPQRGLAHRGPGGELLALAAARRRGGAGGNGANRDGSLLSACCRPARRRPGPAGRGGQAHVTGSACTPNISISLRSGTRSAGTASRRPGSRVISSPRPT